MFGLRPVGRRPAVRRATIGSVIEAVVFDLDGVLIDSEELWDDVRRRFVADHGGTWGPEATRAMQGMSAPEWSAYLHTALGVDLDPGEINRGVVAGVMRRYEDALPLIPGAVEAVARLAARWPLGLASSSNREVINEVLRVSGLGRHFAVTVSSEQVAQGKPAPDVYLEAARQLGADPGACAAVEDSANGIRSAHAARMRVVAVPNHAYPPPADALRLADVVLRGLGELSPVVVAGTGDEEARLDEEEVESFPASDPHSDWAG